jgi:hypothetical protein
MECVWKTDEQEKWERVREKAFSKTIELFMKFLKTQDQLKYGKDLVRGFTYTHITSWNKTDVCRCILWDGVLLKPDEDAQLNIEINQFRGVGECRIYAHKKDMKLTEGWRKASEPDFTNMLKELKRR